MDLKEDLGGLDVNSRDVWEIEPSKDEKFSSNFEDKRDIDHVLQVKTPTVLETSKLIEEASINSKNGALGKKKTLKDHKPLSAKDLERVLESLNINNNLDKLKLQSLNQLTGSEDVVKLPNIQLDTASTIRLLNLESRITRLEKIVGHPNTNENVPNYPLVSQINSISRQLSIITQSDSIQNLQDNLNDLKSLNINNEENVNPKIIRLYEFYISTLPIKNYLPKLINQINYLSTILTDYNNSKHIVVELDSKINTISDMIKSWSSTIDKISTKLDLLNANLVTLIKEISSGKE
ncbi:hypothetical protein TBLA_0C06870 [Henningerozyma blattae CBS 6284]|uniref:Dynactin subunit n=1 Tax=Henningerozyma blattae (strain ATCC 34711 / CBS 6284 / DSM 70876 / NBRC 10599 / NRRL Y-10934 / UCD 77-7) TaxID=1071380 RepID=I2H277_HENB6|nr:hypothetical protein TBLA_0C06870 [Tetrapisispora blattae CBS 6284]CCH60479.1 hypothetical protein TBLA_0C06870 [Tetrapisispora blattae CBS 6284]